MSILDDQFNCRLNDYITTYFEQYIFWYIENTKISKNNMLAALVVIVICVLFFLFIPKSIDQMSFFQYSFDPTFAIKLGLLASILLASVSIFTSYKKMKSCLIGNKILLYEHTLFNERDKDNSGPNDEAAFSEFVSAVDGIMAATNPEVVIAVSQDNALKIKAQESSEC